MRKIYIGCSGWSYKHWVGRYYPKKLASKKWLDFYKNDFNTVEVNMTFYRFPNPNVILSWHKRTPKDFKFTFKGNKLITHTKRLNEIDDLVNRFQELISLIKDKLGCVLWQLPPSIHCSNKNIELIENFLVLLEKKNNNVIEFRHKSWWRKETRELLKKYNASFCSVSALSFPAEFLVVNNLGYVRFHGSTGWYSHNYIEEELKNWAKKINSEKKWKTLYCYFNNDYMAYAPKNARKLKEILES